MTTKRKDEEDKKERSGKENAKENFQWLRCQEIISLRENMKVKIYVTLP